MRAAPWVPGQANEENEEVLQQPQQQHAGSLRTDSSLLLGTSMSKAAATKQQLQQQLGGMNGNAVPFFPKLAAAKQLQQEGGCRAVWEAGGRALAAAAGKQPQDSSCQGECAISIVQYFLAADCGDTYTVFFTNSYCTVV